MKTQQDLIGNHPTTPNIFGVWLGSTDFPVTATKKHRGLTPLADSNYPALVEWFSRKLIEHHYDDITLEKLKDRYSQIGFPAYAEQNRKLPRADRTKKGNAIEVLLIEYVESCQQKKLIKHYKLRYNPNVDQSIKGDDTLLVDIVKNAQQTDTAKIFLGESKFRATPTKTVVDELSSSLASTKKPLSYSFLVAELRRDPSTKPIADLLDNFIVDEIKRQGNITYAGLLVSNSAASTCVETNLNCPNDDLVIVSIGVNNPQQLIADAFTRAELLLQNPTMI